MQEMPIDSILSTISTVPQEWVVCALCSLALAIISCKDYCYYAISDMLSFTHETNNDTEDGCPYLFSSNPWEKQQLPFVPPDFYLNENTKRVAEYAFYTGKMVMLWPAGVVSDLGYSRYVLSAGVLFVVGGFFLLSFFDGVALYMLENFFEGVGEACIYTSIFTLISKWCPRSKLNLFTAIVMAGRIYGDTIGHIFFQLTYWTFRSWKIGHFFIGLFGLLWFATGCIFIYHLPYQSPFVHEEDPHLQRVLSRSSERLVARLQKLPMKKIICSTPFISLALAFCSVEWFSYMNIFLSFKNYQTYILHLPEAFSTESKVMAIVVVPSSIISGTFADWTNKRNLLSKTVTKKLFTFTGIFLSALLQGFATCVGCDMLLFWVLFLTSAYFLGFAVPVVYSTAVDLSPQHAGLLMGIMTGVKTVFALFQDEIGRLVTTGEGNLEQWQRGVIFYSVLSFALTIPFLIFGTGEAQRWQRNNRMTASREPRSIR